MQSCPLLTGNCGSPETSHAEHASSDMRMPHWKAQYGQCVRTVGGAATSSDIGEVITTVPAGHIAADYEEPPKRNDPPFGLALSNDPRAE